MQLRLPTWTPNWLFTANVRCTSINGDAHVNGVNVCKAEVNSLIYGVSFGNRF